MTQPYTGGCACGAIRYSIAAGPAAMADCQCRDCQRRSGTGHGSYLVFAGRQSVALEGKVASWDVVADSGNVKSHGFCPTCGTPVCLTFKAMPDLFAVHAASLDEPARYRPEVVTWAVRGHAWDHHDPAVPRFERMPPR